MIIGIVTNDTRGGVQPYVALARGLGAAGHTVRAVAPGDLAELFQRVGIPVAPLAGHMQEVVKAVSGSVEGGFLSTLLAGARRSGEFLPAWIRTTFEAMEGVDVMLGGLGGMALGLPVAGRLGVPFVEAHLQPIRAPSGDYPPVLLSTMAKRLGRRSWPALHRMSDAMLSTAIMSSAAVVGRRVLGRPRGVVARTMPQLYGISRHVVPIPNAGPHPRTATGYWFVPSTSDQDIPAKLLDFVARPGSVVSIGFGSMPSTRPERDLAMISQAATRLGIRVVVLAGWSGMSAPSDDDRLLVVSEVAHDWLFPRTLLNVHHGGAGTTAAAVRSGQPSVLVPFTMDQPFWAERLFEIGVCPPPIQRRDLNVDTLTEAISSALQDSAIQKRARVLGEKISGEDGVAVAVRALASILSS